MNIYHQRKNNYLRSHTSCTHSSSNNPYNPQSNISNIFLHFESNCQLQDIHSIQSNFDKLNNLPMNTVYTILFSCPYSNFDLHHRCRIHQYHCRRDNFIENKFNIVLSQGRDNILQFHYRQSNWLNFNILCSFPRNIIRTIWLN